MEYYNLDSLVNLIKERNFKVISIQCSDTNESLRLCEYLQEVFPKETGKNFYILGDVLTGSCCLDIIATKRLKTDCIVYIGESCFFDLETQYHVFYLYPKLKIDPSLLYTKVNDLLNSENFETALLVYKCTFHHLVDRLAELLMRKGKKLLVAACPDNEKFGNFGKNEDEFVLFCNRRTYEYYSEEGETLKRPGKKETFTKVDLVLYMNDSEEETMSKSIALETRCKKVYELRALEEGCCMLNRDNWNQELWMKRYLAVEKAKECENFGLLTLTKSFKNGNKMRRSLQELIKKKKKKCTIFCINQLTEAKLQNFPRIEVWVLLSCNLAQLSLDRDLGRFVIFPYELLVALDVVDWSEECYFYDFGRITKVVDNYILVNYEEGEEDVSKDSSEKKEHNELRTIKKMELSRRFEDLYETISSKEKREFKGLDPDYDFDKKPVVIKGSSGTPASYKHELEYK